MDDNSDDPDERRKKMEAKIAAENMGAALGLIAGTSLAIGHHNNTKENGAPEADAPNWEQSMG